MKKITALAVLLIIVLANLVSCNQGNGGFANTTNMQDIETESTKNTASITEDGIITLDESLLYQDNKTYKIGSHLNLVFNPEFCDVKYSVKKGLGTSENVRLEVKMKNGYHFQCFTESNYLPNIENTSQILSYANNIDVSLSEEKTIYINYLIEIRYDINAPDGVKIDETGIGLMYPISLYPISYYKCPKTMLGTGFKRVGYTLIGYSQNKDDYSSVIPVGSRFVPNSSTPTLYCVWEKQDGLGDFVFEKEDDHAVLVKYTGSKEKIVVPEKWEGLKVEKIAKDAFTDDNIQELILPNTIKILEDGFLKSSNLSTLYLYDSVVEMYDSLSNDCPNLRNFRINTIYTSFDSWAYGTYNKYDRLLWASEKKKIVICGGSGTWYGYNCEMMTEEFGGEYVIINMGMNANMCSCALIEGISNLMNEGDLFLWSPEPIERVLGDVEFDEKTWWFTSGDYGIFNYIDISNYKNVFSTFASFNISHSKNQKADSLIDKNENIYGDNITKRENEVSFVTYNSYSKMSNGNIQSIFAKMKESGVKVVLSYAAMAKDQPGTDERTLKLNEEALKSSFDIDFISEYKDCLYDISYFYNSEWHMTNEGAIIRTENVIKDLKKYLENN